jgi:Lysine methyltransferase
LRGLLTNLRRNLGDASVTGGEVEVAEMVWSEHAGDLDAELQRRAYDIVVAADCVYNEHVVPRFVATLKIVCEGANAAGGMGIGVIAQELRSEEVHEVFLRYTFTVGFSVVRIPREWLDERFRGGYVVYLLWLSK